ncbi:MAG TPA: ATP-binding protein [Rhodocyclaceae bacterium]|nr:ATP-binding protein [Rhodocyclaceae bacterium]
MIERHLLAKLRQRLAQQPAVAILGPRQVGKTTLAQAIAEETPDALFLDLEREADRARIADPERFFGRHRDRLLILDEVQTLPDLFTHLRPEIDAKRTPGRFLLLGSASGKLLQQSAESLAGRIAYLELPPISLDEAHTSQIEQDTLWLRGGFPQSLLARDDDASLQWRSDFLQTFLARDLPQLGITIPAQTLGRFWRMCAHLHGQQLNASQLGLALGGSSHTTALRYLDILVDTMMLRRLEPFHINIGKRLVKSPKVYVRDSGLLHALLNIGTLDDLSAHPSVGHSWEGFILEQIIGRLPSLATYGFYRTAAGAEIDLVVDIGGKRTGYEIKLSSAPKLTKGFWNACEDLGLDQAYVVASVNEPYPLASNVEVISPQELPE